MCKRIKIEVDREEYCTPIVPQDRALAAAVLGRSFWDLDYISHDRETVKSAVHWFEATEESEYPFTFKNVFELFGLCEAHQEILEAALEEAKQFLAATYGNRKLNKHAFARKMKHSHCFRQKVGIMRYG